MSNDEMIVKNKINSEKSISYLSVPPLNTIGFLGEKRGEFAGKR